MDVQKSLEQIAQGFLNDPGVRKALGKIDPALGKLEGLDSITNLKLTSLSVAPIRNGLITLGYEGTAAQGFYPNVRARLIEAGVVKKGNVQSVTKDNKGQHDEYEILHMSFHGSLVQLYLRVYNPNYHTQ